MFEKISAAPPDPIFGLMELTGRDTRSHKADLWVGVYTDEEGRTPTLAAVHEAERRLLEANPEKVYLPIAGKPDYGERVERLLFGDDHEIVTGKRAATAQTAGGTAALRVAGEIAKLAGRTPTIWMSDPTWVNHLPVFEAAGLAVAKVPYFDRTRHELMFAPMMAALEGAKASDLVLLHGCCHNPTGLDPTPEEWAEIGDLLARRRAIPVVDVAYQGFAEGLYDDMESLRILAERVPELVICTSFSKNFGLYNERAGALVVVAETSGQARAVRSQIERTIRAIYSNPPAHGAAIVTTILGDPELRKLWEEELRAMRHRIRRMRELFSAGLDRRNVRLHEGTSSLTEQRGMFSFLNLGPAEILRLREEHAVYTAGGGRINVAGLREENVDRVCDAVAAVVSGA